MKDGPQSKGRFLRGGEVLGLSTRKDKEKKTSLKSVGK